MVLAWGRLGMGIASCMCNSSTAGIYIRIYSDVYAHMHSNRFQNKRANPAHWLQIRYRGRSIIRRSTFDPQIRYIRSIMNRSITDGQISYYAGVHQISYMQIRYVPCRSGTCRSTTARSVTMPASIRSVTCRSGTHFSDQVLRDQLRQISCESDLRRIDQIRE